MVGSSAADGAENLTFDGIVSALAADQLDQEQVEPLQSFEVAYESPFRGIFRLNRTPNGSIIGVEVEVTNPYPGHEAVLFRGSAELKPVKGEQQVPFGCGES